MQKQNYVTIIICASLCAATLFISFSSRVRATDPTILDYSSADSEGNITIGNEHGSIQITTNGSIYFKSNRIISIEGMDSENQPISVSVQGGTVALGDISDDHMHARILIDNDTPTISGDGTITTSVPVTEP